MVLIYICLVISDVEYLCMCLLAIFMSSFEIHLLCLVFNQIVKFFLFNCFYIRPPRLIVSCFCLVVFLFFKKLAYLFFVLSQIFEFYLLSGDVLILETYF